MISDNGLDAQKQTMGLVPHKRPPSPDVTDAMRGLIQSVEPAVVFSSLARSCIPAFSDACTVELSEGVEALFQVTFPVADEGALFVRSDSVTAGGRAFPFSSETVSTSFQAESTRGHPSFAGVVSHSWIEHEPTDDDVTIARLLVDHSVAMVRQERLVESLQQAENRATKLALELITCGVVGQAIGILMTKHKTPRNEAFSFTRRVIRAITNSTKLHLMSYAQGNLSDPPDRGPSIGLEGEGFEASPLVSSPQRAAPSSLRAVTWYNDLYQLRPAAITRIRQREPRGVVT
jgi:hypothetical protein